MCFLSTRYILQDFFYHATEILGQMYSFEASGCQMVMQSNLVVRKPIVDSSNRILSPIQSFSVNTWMIESYICSEYPQLWMTTFSLRAYELADVNEEDG